MNNKRCSYHSGNSRVLGALCQNWRQRPAMLLTISPSTHLTCLVWCILTTVFFYGTIPLSKSRTFPLPFRDHLWSFGSCFLPSNPSPGNSYSVFWHYRSPFCRTTQKWVKWLFTLFWSGFFPSSPCFGDAPILVRLSAWVSFFSLPSMEWPVRLFLGLWMRTEVMSSSWPFCMKLPRTFVDTPLCAQMFYFSSVSTKPWNLSGRC